jgi:hypothetical protein
MYKVMYEEKEINDCLTLADAMKFAKTVESFVTIKGPDFDLVGKFGVDSVVDGKCPDGVD